jgi:DNA polymerase-3 subunit delta'
MNIIGHSRQLKILNRILKQGITSGSFIFSGPEHVGKFTIANNFAGKINKVADKFSADIEVVTPEAEESRGQSRRHDIKIEKVRELRQWLNLAPAVGKKRIAIINEADRLNVAAQNALLKILEEPQRNCLVILVVQNEQKILPTILSRCQKMFFGTVSEEILAKHIPVDHQDRDKLIFWSFGRPGILISLLNDPRELMIREETFNELKNLMQRSLDERFGWAEKSSQDMEKVVVKLNLWLAILRQSLLGGNFKINKSSEEKMKIIGKIEESLILLKETNVNSRLTLENLLINL